jgi:hypothetical protein
MKIPGLDDAVQERLTKCAYEITLILDRCFPEFRASYDDNFDERVCMTLYMELIHAGFFKDKMKCE